MLEHDTADVVAVSRPERHLGDTGRRRAELALSVRQKSAARARHRRSRSGGRPRPPGSEMAARRFRLRAVRGTARSRRTRPCVCRWAASDAGWTRVDRRKVRQRAASRSRSTCAAHATCSAGQEQQHRRERSG